jgi:hypothetical protein
MLGTDKSRGYCLEMICADFLAGAHLDNGNPGILLNSISHYYRFLPGAQQQAFVEAAGSGCLSEVQFCWDCQPPVVDEGCPRRITALNVVSYYHMCGRILPHA